MSCAPACMYKGALDRLRGAEDGMTHRGWFLFV